jgi:hypothetical protein
VKSTWARIKTPGEITTGQERKPERKPGSNLEVGGIYYEMGLMSIEKNESDVGVRYRTERGSAGCKSQG